MIAQINDFIINELPSGYDKLLVREVCTHPRQRQRLVLPKRSIIVEGLLLDEATIVNLTE